MICRDKSTTYLNRFGYNVVRHPQTSIGPLGVLGRKNRTVKYLGSLNQLVNSSVGLPEIETDLPATDISGQSTDDLHIGFGLSLMKSVLTGLGGNPEVKSSFKRARAVNFRFNNVLLDRVAPLSVAKYLNDQVLDDDPLLAQYAEGDGTLYVITEIVKSRSLSVTAKNKKGTEVEIDVPTLQTTVGANVKVEPASESTVSYIGNKDLVFGFGCFEIGLEAGKFALFSTRPGSTTAMALGAGHTAGGALLGENILVDVT